MQKEKASKKLEALCLLVRAKGLEPSRVLTHWILSPARLPFRHARFLKWVGTRIVPTLIGEPCWTRTSDTLIKSQVLYRLS
jgi:hypothetical protein